LSPPKFNIYFNLKCQQEIKYCIIYIQMQLFCYLIILYTNFLDSIYFLNCDSSKIIKDSFTVNLHANKLVLDATFPSSESDYSSTSKCCIASCTVKNAAISLSRLCRTAKRTAKTLLFPAVAAVMCVQIPPFLQH
jgi:hypothetical protein